MRDMNCIELGDLKIAIGDGNYSSKYPSAAEFVSEGIPFISSADFEGRIFKSGEIRRISEELHNTLQKGHLKKDDILIVVRGNSCGKVGLVPDEYENANINAQIAFIRCDNETINSHFLYYLLETDQYQKRIKMLCTGSAQPQLPIKNLKKLVVEVPSYRKQLEIVSIIKDIDEKAYICYLINNNLMEQSNALFEFFFGKDLLLNSESFMMSKMKLGDVGLDITDGNYSTKYPAQNEFTEKGVPFIRGADFDGIGISSKNLIYISAEKHAELLKGHTKKNDILLTTRGNGVGKVAILSDEFVDSNLNAQLIRVNGGKKVPRSYLACYFNSHIFQKEIKNMVTGSALPQLPIGKLKSMDFVLPNKERIDCFDNIIEPIFQLIFANREQIYKLQSMKKKLFMKLLFEDV